MGNLRMKVFGLIDLVSVVFQLLVLGFVALASIMSVEQVVGLTWLPVLTGCTLSSVAAVHAMQLGATFDIIRAANGCESEDGMNELKKAWTGYNVHTVCSSPLWYSLLAIPLVVENTWVLNQTFPLFFCNSLFRILLHVMIDQGDDDVNEKDATD